MAMFAKQTKADYSIEDGKYPAILFQIISLGSQRFEKNGKEWFSPQVLLGFELPTLTYENQDGFLTSNIKSGTYFLSLNSSRNGLPGLREIIEGMIGRELLNDKDGNTEEFDVSSLMGKPCVIELSGVESKGKVYQNITGITQYTGETLAPRRTPILVEPEAFKTLDMLDLPEWIKDKIMKSKEYQALEQQSTGDENVDSFIESLDKMEKTQPTGMEDKPLDF